MHMMQFMINHQLNIMMMLSGICGALTILVLVSRGLTKQRRRSLALMQITGMLLITFDRLAYIYSGDISPVGYVMVRVSNFIVFFLTSEVVFAFNMYLSDLLSDEGQMKKLPRRLTIVNVMAFMGMFLIVFSQFTGIIYTFDEANRYQRSPLFFLCYILPILGPLLQLSVILQYRKKFSRIIYWSLILYLVVPIIASIIQFVAYGISLTNMAIVVVSLSLYVFAYFDINESLRQAHEKELTGLKEEQSSIMRLFKQTTMALVGAIEEKDEFGRGHSVRVADRAKKIAKAAGKGEQECEEIYYAALLHNVGLTGLSEKAIEIAGKPGEEDNEEIKKKPEIGARILSGITEYPQAKDAALYSCERYDGGGYPEGLKGKEIPDVARIVAVADAYDTLTSKKKYRDPLPDAIIREEFVKESGSKYDPEYSRLMIEMMDADANERYKKEVTETETKIESELKCEKYRGTFARGIDITRDVVRISFTSTPMENIVIGSCMPSIVLYDSFDARVHDNAKAIEAYKYLEYGEIWFDGHIISTGARNMELENETEFDGSQEGIEERKNKYEIVAGRFEDHVKLKITGPVRSYDVIIALQDSTKSSYIGLTGEYCNIKDIKVEKTGEVVREESIRRIADRISYIDRMESDLPNIQIDRPRSASTEGIPITGDLRVVFHTMSLPTSSLVWHCPYIVLFYSEDGRVGGQGYREYELVKINGENNGSNEYATNQFVMKKEDFEGWDQWKERNKEGFDCELVFSRRGSRFTMTTENLGIYTQLTSTINNGPSEIYAAITGDQCAITDIRIFT